MPMPTNTPALRVTARMGAVQYDGTNASFIAGCLTDGSVNSASGSTCNIQVAESFNFDCPVNHWVMVDGSGSYYGVLSPEAFETAWAVIPNAVAGLGIEPVPLLTAGSQTTVSVAIVPSMTDMDFTAAPALSGAANLLGSLSILSHTKVSESQVDVTVKNNGLISLSGAAVFVTCVPN